jgi:thiol-disulfide isomerase/thioredoxin
MKAQIVIALISVGVELASAADPPSPAHAYTVRGIVELQAIRWSDTTKTFYYDFETNYFDLQVKDCRWLIKLGSQRPEVYDYRIVSSDGASTFRLLSYETRLKMAEASGRKLPTNIGDGSVMNGTIPRFDLAPEAGALWIAYASGCHFAEDAYSVRRSVPFADYISSSPIQEGDPPAVENAFWQLASVVPHLPTMLVYAVENMVGVGSLAPGLFTNVIYEALSFIDVEGLRFPRESTVSIYRSLVRSGSTTTQLCQRVHVVGTNIAIGAELESFKPRLFGRTVISEYRFDNGSGLRFSYISDNHWASEPTARNSEAYREAKARLSGDAENFLAIGTNAPDIKLLSLSGDKQRNLSDYRGRLTILEFWGTWCPPCQTAMAEIQTYADKHSHWGKKVALITLNLDEDRKKAAIHAERKGWNKTENFWVPQEVTKAYSFNGIPMVYIVDERGKVAAAGHEMDIPSKIDQLLRERKP